MNKNPGGPRETVYRRNSAEAGKKEQFIAKKEKRKIAILSIVASTLLIMVVLLSTITVPHMLGIRKAGIQTPDPSMWEELPTFTPDEEELYDPSKEVATPTPKSTPTRTPDITTPDPTKTPTPKPTVTPEEASIKELKATVGGDMVEISFRLEGNGKVTLRILNAQDQVVATLIDGEQLSADMYRGEWTLPSVTDETTYKVRCSVGGEVASTTFMVKPAATPTPTPTPTPSSIASSPTQIVPSASGSPQQP